MTRQQKMEEKKLAKEIILCRQLIGGRAREARAINTLKSRGLTAEDIEIAVDIERGYARMAAPTC